MNNEDGNVNQSNVRNSTGLAVKKSTSDQRSRFYHNSNDKHISVVKQDWKLFIAVYKQLYSWYVQH